MKFRFGFVSNSSSSSFILDVTGLKESQKNKIRHHLEFSMGMHSEFFKYGPAWDITEKGDSWECFTFIDNFDLARWVVEVVGVPMDRISKFERNGDYSEKPLCT